MASVLQGFEEVNLVEPAAKATMTVTASVIRFSKDVAQALGFAPYAKVLVNSRKKQIAVQGCAAKEDNTVKFSRAEGKQTTSIAVKDEKVVAAVAGYFELPEGGEDEVGYQTVEGVVYAKEGVVIFNVADAVAGTSKKRGRKKTA